MKFTKVHMGYKLTSKQTRKNPKFDRSEFK